jgi:hypothetical protein
VSREGDANCLADDLESLRTGKLSEAGFRAKWQTAVGVEPLAAIWPNLDHYLADGDIRERDRDYGAMQDAEMDKLVRLIRAGAPAGELGSITFLRRSGR